MAGGASIGSTNPPPFSIHAASGSVSRRSKVLRMATGTGPTGAATSLWRWPRLTAEDAAVTLLAVAGPAVLTAAVIRVGPSQERDYVFLYLAVVAYGSGRCA